MIKNYLTIAFRSIKKNLIYSVINILGLSIGLASFLLISIWIHNELSYDDYHEHADRLYRSDIEFAQGGLTMKTSNSPTAMLPALQSFPEVERGAKIFKPGMFNPLVVKADDNLFMEPDLYYADSSIFEIFTFEFLQGTKEALYQPDGAALSKSVAIKYFGDTDPIGKVLEINNKLFTVKAVYEDMPANTHFHADLFIPFSAYWAAKQQSWGSANYGTYFLLNENASLEQLNEKINELIKNEFGMPMTSENYAKINFIPVKDIHLYSEADHELEPKGSYTYILIFSAVAFLVLVIACINYMNLASAKAIERAREVGVRKVMGAYRTQLIGQFIGEAIILTFIAGAIALVLVNVAIPIFSSLAGFSFSVFDIMNLEFIAAFVGVLLIVAFLSGSYPAIIISSFNPQQVLKGVFAHSNKGVFFRKFLVVFQFVITVVLITSTFIIYKQLNYVQDKNLGYQKEQVIQLPYNRAVREKYDHLAAELMKIPAVEKVSRGSDSPVNSAGGYTISLPVLEEGNSMVITGLATDENYISTMGIELKSGRDFREGDWQLLNDTVYSFIINEAAQDALLLTDEEVIGMEASLNGRKGNIVGVAKDFHFSGLQNKISPLIMFLEPQYNDLFIKLNTENNVAENVSRIGETWNAVVPETLFHYTFLNDDYEALYQSEVKLGRLFIIFAVLDIFIACLGLFGLISYMAVQRAKEIGVRKILGASVSNLMVMLSSDYARLILIAFIVSIPIAWYFMNIWLENFAYKVSVGFLPFALSAAIVMMIGILTVSYQSYKAATDDPVKALKSE